MNEQAKHLPQLSNAEILERAGKIKCYQKDCQHFYPHSTLVEMLTPELRFSYLQSIHNARKISRANALMNHLKSGNLEKLIMEASLRALFRRVSPDGKVTYAALMCPKCKYGPVEHIFCGNLSAHHGQKVGQGTINNSCPKCKFFANQKSEWLAWDGAFL